MGCFNSQVEKPKASRIDQIVKPVNSLKSALKHSVEKSEKNTHAFNKEVGQFDLRFSRKHTQLVDKHAEELECPICSFVYNSHQEKPLLLPCGHSFCKKCLSKEYNASFYIKCPLDRIEHQISPEELPVVYSLISLSEEILKTPLCKVHRLPLTNYCATHLEVLCKKCLNSHSQDKLYALDDSVLPIANDWYKSVQNGIPKLKETKEEMEEHKSEVEEIENSVKCAFANHLKEVNEEHQSLVKNLKVKVDTYTRNIRSIQDELHYSSPSTVLRNIAESIENEISQAKEFIERFDQISLTEKLQKFKEGPIVHTKIRLPAVEPFVKAKEALERVQNHKSLILDLIE